MQIRVALALLAALGFVGCDYFSVDREDLPGTYALGQHRLTLRDDGRYVSDDEEIAVGEWDLTHYFGTHLLGLEPDRGGYISYRVQRSLTRNIRIYSDDSESLGGGE